MTENLKPETGNRNDDLFQWGHKQAVGSRTQDPGIKDQSVSISMDLRLIEMMAILRDRRVIHADELKDRFGWDERTCRAIAAASGGHIISTHDGYLLTERATPEEFDAANGRIYSQAKNMLRRAIKERRVRHQLVSRT